MAAWAIIEETGAAQFLRDVRVTAIYEGTNGIQAMDLVGRKFADGGDAAFRADRRDRGRRRGRARRPARPRPARSGARPRRCARRPSGWSPAATWTTASPGAVPYPACLRPRAGRALPPARGRCGRAGRPRAALARVYIARLLPEHAGASRRGATGQGRSLRAGPTGPRRVTRPVGPGRARDPLPLRRAARRGCRPSRSRRRRPVDASAAADGARPRQRLRAGRRRRLDGGRHRARQRPELREAWAATPGRAAGRRTRSARVLVTHHHPDHVGLAGWFQTAHDAELLTTRDRLALRADADARRTGVADARDAGLLARRRGCPRRCSTQRAAERPFNFARRRRPLPLGFTPASPRADVLRCRRARLARPDRRRATRPNTRRSGRRTATS